LGESPLKKQPMQTKENASIVNFADYSWVTIFYPHCQHLHVQVLIILVHLLRKEISIGASVTDAFFFLWKH
jgi:hypothetical protein